MKRTTFLILAYCWAATCLTAAEDRAPNLILIMADDLGYGDLSCYGNEQIETPELDRLAAEGTRLTDFHSSGNVCSPTRAGLMTGRYQQRAGLPQVINADPKQKTHRHGLQVQELTFAEILRAHGYETAVFGKWHLGYYRRFNPVHHGFMHFRGFVSGNIDYLSHYDRMETYDWWDDLELVREAGYSTHLITRHGVEFIRANRDRPFCLYLAHEAVHAPWQGPHDAIGRGPNKVKNRRVDRKRAFAEMLVELDRGVGRVRETVEQLGLQTHTFIFFCSDNGPAGGSAGPLRGRKGSHWEGGHRVPGIAWWPGHIPAGVERDDLTITLDLMPTLLELAAATVPAGRELDGRSLVPILFEGQSLGPRHLFWNGKAMRDGLWKLIRDGRDGPRVGLYHLGDDLGESKNLASVHPSRVARMTAALETWSQSVASDATSQEP